MDTLSVAITTNSHIKEKTLPLHIYIYPSCVISENHLIHYIKGTAINCREQLCTYDSQT